MMLISFYYGVGIWSLPLSSLFPSYFLASSWGQYTLLDVNAAFFFIVLVCFQLPTRFSFFYCSLFFVYRKCKASNRSFLSAVSNLSTITVFLLGSYLWISHPDSKILQNNFILFTLTTGFVFGRMATKIILSHVTDGPFPASSILLLPIMIANVWIRISTVYPFHEETFLYVYFILSAVIYFYWSISITNTITKALGIKCFTITKPKKK